MGVGGSIGYLISKGMKSLMDGYSVFGPFQMFLSIKILSLDDNVGCRHRGQTHGNHTMSLNCGHHQPAMAA